MKSTPFVQQRTLAVFFGVTKYDKVQKKKEDGSLAAAIRDVPYTKEVCVDL